MSPDISIVVVNWNTRDHLERCLASIPAGTAGLSAETIVVDNGSADGSRDILNRLAGRITVVSNDGNAGFAAGVNQGCARARGRALLILNPDIVLHGEAVPALLRTLERTPQAGAVMPALADVDGRRQTGYIRRLPGLAQVFFFSTALAGGARRIPALVRRYLEETVPGSGPVREVEQLPGACMLVKREVLDGVGVMDEGYRLFFEDVDWCRRIRDAGWKLLLDPAVTVTHAGGGSFGRVRKDTLAARFGLSCLRYFRLHEGRGRAAAAAAILTLNALVMIPVRLLQVVLRIDAGRGREALLAHRAFLVWLWRGAVHGADLPLSALTPGSGDGRA